MIAANPFFIAQSIVAITSSRLVAIACDHFSLENIHTEGGLSKRAFLQMTAAMISRTAPRKKKVGRYVVNDILGGRLRIAGGLFLLAPEILRLPRRARDLGWDL